MQDKFNATYTTDTIVYRQNSIQLENVKYETRMNRIHTCTNK